MTSEQLLEAIFDPTITVNLSEFSLCKGCNGFEFDDDVLIDGYHWNCKNPVVVAVPRDVVERLVTYMENNKY